MKRAVHYILAILLVIFAGAQALRPERGNPPEDPDLVMEKYLTVTPEVSNILERACKDCHSNRTAWPWYSNVAPASWLVADHVKEGRKHLNFSVFGMFDESEQEDLLKEMCKEVRGGHMPIPSYLYLHPEAKLSAADQEVLCGWTKQQVTRLADGGGE